MAEIIKRELDYSQFQNLLLSLTIKEDEMLNQMMSLSDIIIRNRDIYMNKNELFDLKSQGHFIGGHSMNHPNYSDIDSEEQLHQVSESVTYCSINFEEKLKLFAFPFYDYNIGKDLYDKMRSEVGVDISFGTSGMKDDVIDFSVQRLIMDGITDPKNIPEKAIYQVYCEQVYRE